MQQINHQADISHFPFLLDQTCSLWINFTGSGRQLFSTIMFDPREYVQGLISRDSMTPERGTDFLIISTWLAAQPTNSINYIIAVDSCNFQPLPSHTFPMYEWKSLPAVSVKSSTLPARIFGHHCFWRTSEWRHCKGLALIVQWKAEVIAHRNHSHQWVCTS